VVLHAEIRGSGPPLALLHGFTQTGRLWGPFGVRLAEAHTLVALDLPGHAGSDAVRADLGETAGLVAESVRAEVGDEPCDVLGYSLGARVALHVLVASKMTVRRAVLIGVTGGIEDAGERARRRAADDALAERLEAAGDVEGFVDEWLRSPLFAGLPDSAADRAERLRNSATGLAASLRLNGTGTQEPLWDDLRAVTLPVLALAGTDDIRFAAHALRVQRMAPQALASLVPGGGHAVHLAQPDHAGRIVEHWLAAGRQLI
jgi:2-succinyl-6-hydroxy-2,4-cyclohexadiene-1-carboxylate synthase